MNGFTKLVTGNLGGGKTSWLVEIGYEHMRAGGYFATNIEVKADAIRARMAAEGYEFDPSRLRVLTGGLDDFYAQIWRGMPDCVVMVAIDEAAIVGFNSRDFAKLNRTVFNFCTLVRKLDVGLYWATQRPQFFDKQLRDLCQSLIDCRDTSQLRFMGIIPFPIRLLVRVYHQNIGGRFEKTHSEVVTRKKWVWKLYNSDALLGQNAQAFSTMERVSASALKRTVKPQSILAPAIFATLCAAFFSSF